MSLEKEYLTKIRTRSPAYPTFGLPKAIELAGKLWTSQRKADSHIDSALSAMGYARHGESLRIIAALGHFGLIEDSGTGDKRRIKLSERAQDILHLPDSDTRKQNALREAALAPAIYAALWERYSHVLPADSAIRPFLIRDKGFNDGIVDDVIKGYRESFELAGLGKMEDANAAKENVASAMQQPNTAQQNPKSGGLVDPTTLWASAEELPELPILIGNNRQARIPFPMSEDDFDLLIGTLNLWKKKIVAPNSANKTSTKVDDY